MKAHVKKYDPTQYNFENFANTMNKNYAIERSQNSQGGAFGTQTMPGNVVANANNPINLGSATNSQTLGNFGFNSVLSGFKKSLDGFALGGQVDIQGDEPVLPDNKTPGSVDIASDTTPEETPIVTSQLSSAPASTPTSTPASTYRPEKTAYNELVKMYESGTTDIKELSRLIRRKYDKETVAAAFDIFRNSYLGSDYNKIMSGDSKPQEIFTWIESLIKDNKPNVLSIIDQIEQKYGYTNGSPEKRTLDQLRKMYNTKTGEDTGFLSWLDGINITKTPDLTFEEWQSTYSVDPVQEYEYAQAQLDYEFKTWMSDYGARAEQLYQMGLSNSGVSDIYGANAYSAYIQSSMALKREQIKLQQENQRNYQTYLDEKKSAANTRIGTAYAAYESSYTPEGSQGIYNSLIGQGMSASDAAEVIRRLDAHYNAIPVDSRPDVVAKNAKVNDAVTWLNTNYAYGMTDAELLEMLTSNYDEETAAEALAKFAPFKAVFDRLASDSAAQSTFAAMLELMEAGDTDIESLKQKAKGLGHSDDAIAKAAENIMPFLQSAEAEVNPHVVNAYTSLLSTYTKEQESNIRTLYKNLGWNDQDVDELINMLNSSIDASNQTIINNTVGTLEATADVSPETIVMSTLVDNLKDYKIQLAAGKITQEQYDQYARSFSYSAVKAYEWAVKSVDNMANAYAMFGFDETEWAGMNDAARESAIMDAMAEYRKEGLVSAKDYNSVIKNWSNSEIKAAIAADKENGPATGLRDFGSIAADLLEWKKSGALSEKEYLEQLENIISSSGLYVDTKIKWSTVPTADTHIRMIGMDAVGTVTDENLISILDKNADVNKGSYVAYNGKLYVKRLKGQSLRAVWQPLDIDHYDLPWTGATFTKTQREGIHELLKILYGVKPPKDTRR